LLRMIIHLKCIFLTIGTRQHFAGTFKVARIGDYELPQLCMEVSKVYREAKASRTDCDSFMEKLGIKFHKIVRRILSSAVVKGVNKSVTNGVTAGVLW